MHFPGRQGLARPRYAGPSPVRGSAPGTRVTMTCRWTRWRSGHIQAAIRSSQVVAG